MVRYRLILISTFVLLIFGLVMVGDSSLVSSSRDFGDQWKYLKLQGMWTVISLVGFLIAGKLPLKLLEKFALPIFSLSIILLLLVLIPGIGSKILGARRWINLGLFSLQPSEFAKISLIIFLSSLLRQKDKFISFLVILGIMLGLVMFQPDLGTSLVLLGSGLTIYFVSNQELRKLLILLPVGLIAIGALILTSPYRLNRVKTFLDYSHDPLGSSYQIRQSLLGLGSGGITGVGFGQSRQKYEYLPEAMTDSVFAIIGEELGLIGGLIVIATFTVLVINGFQVAASTDDEFQKFLAVGISSLIGLQAFINISAIVALVPLTGIPLPFISYGGSSLLTMLFSTGLLLNIAKNARTK